MSNVKRFLMVFMALVIILAATGLAFQPAQAAGCAFYHTVSRGETLSWIGRYYGVNWVYLAQINGIHRPYTIYPWQQLCISYGGGTGGQPEPDPGKWSAGWDYRIVGVDPGKSVTIRTSNFPSNVLFDVSIGTKGANGQYQWVAVGQIDSGKGGSFKQQFTIPAAYAAQARLFVRIVQARKGTTVDHWFNNTAAGGTGGAGGWDWLRNYGWWWGNIPTIWIAAVERNNRVLVYANNFPPGLDFNVYMGWMGTRGTNPGIHSGVFYAGENQKWFNIPAQLYDQYQISIRTQNQATGYYSYNWFYNNTADVR